MSGQDGYSDWAPPQDLIARTPSQPYPLEALPPRIRDAVQEVQSFIQAPVPVVAISALSAVSVAVQGHIDIQRARRLQGPSGTFMLGIAESGERKTTADSFFSGAIRAYEDKQADALQNKIEDYEAEKAAWESQISGLKDRIRKLARDKKSTTEATDELRLLQRKRPYEPQRPKLLLMDETPENLAYSLARYWPVGGVMSSEAAVVFGSHGMGRDSVVRSLGLLNVLWDGGTLTIGRRSSERFDVRGARLTVGLQVQEATLAEFFDRAGALARGTGFLARFLISWPESTQGTRMFRESPARWPAMDAFNERMSQVLNQPLRAGEWTLLEPEVLTFTAKAKEVWVQFYNSVERELAPNGDLYDVRDVAAKTADNAARLAAQFHYFDGETGSVGAEAIRRGCALAAWHLNESRRFFEQLAVPEEVSDAVRLDEWLRNEFRRSRSVRVRRQRAQQYGPVRDNARLNAASEYLVGLDRLRLDTIGRRKELVVNPRLVGLEVAL